MNNMDIIALLKSDISKTDNLNEKIAIIAKYAKKITNADRCSLFLYNKEKDQLRSIYADGINGTIALKSNAGIIGYAFHKKESILENNTALSSIFLKAVDQQSGYQTKTVLAVPIIGAGNKRLGAIQLLNKEEGFNETDKKNIEELVKVSVPILDPQNDNIQIPDSIKNKEETALEALQNNFDKYLADKKLFFMDDGNVYYKILNMKRDYYIGADKCYTLEGKAKKVDILHYDTISNELVFTVMLVKIDKMADALLISDKVDRENFARYPLEKE